MHNEVQSNPKAHVITQCHHLVFIFLIVFSNIKKKKKKTFMKGRKSSKKIILQKQILQI